jgi:hypothetical protein
VKKKLSQLAALIFGFVCMSLILVNGYGWAQNIDNEPQVIARSSSEPVQEDNSEAIPWNTSAPIPDGVQIQSPPDLPSRLDPVDSEERVSYNASLRVAGSVLKPRESDVEWSVGGQGGCLYALSGDQYTWFNTPLYLEQGSTIKYLRMYYNDQNVSSNSSAFLTVYDLYGDLIEEFGVSSSGTGKAYVTSAEFEHVVDYDNYSYVIHWRANSLGSAQQVCGFRVYYLSPSISTYLPLIEKD